MTREKAIEGYNEEKRILANALTTLGSSNDDIPRRGAINRRLEQIDKVIKELLTKN